MTAPTIRRRFGQTALATPANFVTLTRIVVAVPTLMLIYDDGSSWPAVLLWFILSTSDTLDGYLARRDGTTRSGAFLDPIADKLIVLGGMSALAARGDVSWLPVAIIAGREVVISAYRSLAGRRGISLPARSWGKWKTFSQFLAVGAVLLPWTSTWTGVQELVMWIAVSLTVVSGIDIVRYGWRDAREHSAERREGSGSVR
jgi:CDP-diacylglycerol--glycerol-3-phosphate 3-phosphatidyltransferase